MTPESLERLKRELKFNGEIAIYELYAREFKFDIGVLPDGSPRNPEHVAIIERDIANLQKLIAEDNKNKKWPAIPPAVIDKKTSPIQVVDAPVEEDVWDGPEMSAADLAELKAIMRGQRSGDIPGDFQGGLGGGKPRNVFDGNWDPRGPAGPGGGKPRSVFDR